MNLLKTRVYVVKNTATEEYMTSYSDSMIHYPIPELSWGSLNDAMLFNSPAEIRDFINHRKPLDDLLLAHKAKLMSIPVELHIDKVVNIAGQPR